MATHSFFQTVFQREGSPDNQVAEKRIKEILGSTLASLQDPNVPISGLFVGEM